MHHLRRRSLALAERIEPRPAAPRLRIRLQGRRLALGIYLSRRGSKLWVEGSGNNITGLSSTRVTFDEELLQLTAAGSGDDTMEKDVLEFVRLNPGKPQHVIEDAVTGKREAIRRALRRLEERQLVTLGRGGHANGNYWYPSDSSTSDSPLALGASGGEAALDPSRPTRPALKGAGDGGAGEGADRGAEGRGGS